MAKLTKHYISHDENASRDEKILKMREKYGARGYGLFWEIVEYLFTTNGKAELNAKVVSLAIGEDVRTVRKFLFDCIEVYRLFESDGTYFWSNRLLNQINKIIAISVVKSKAVQKRYEKDSYNFLFDNDIDDAEIKEGTNTCTTDVLQVNNSSTTINKIKEINKINSYCREKKPQQNNFLKPSIEEIEAYCMERKNAVDPIQFFDYYEANGWKVGRNSMKDWKAAVRTWERNENGGKKPKAADQNDPYAELR
jgi:hypothetical protein